MAKVVPDARAMQVSQEIADLWNIATEVSVAGGSLPSDQAVQHLDAAVRRGMRPAVRLSENLFEDAPVMSPPTLSRSHDRTPPSRRRFVRHATTEGQPIGELTFPQATSTIRGIAAAGSEVQLRRARRSGLASAVARLTLPNQLPVFVLEAHHGNRLYSSIIRSGGRWYDWFADQFDASLTRPFSVAESNKRLAEFAQDRMPADTLFDV